MIVQTIVVMLTLSVALIIDVNGTSFSNVYVESEVAPVGYYSYGTPYPSIANPRLSQINSLPTVHGYVGPCVSPCVYPAQTVTTVTPVQPNPNVVTYNAPSSPVIVAPTKQEATGYEYSYLVYDQNTGDHKAQRELSDGSVVRGEYSFLQPDGYIREVQYVADDVSGFNAVVKKFLPVSDESNKKGTAYENKASPPCQETKNESLKEGSEENHGNSKQSEEDENSKEKHNKATKEASKEESGEESDENYSKILTHSKEASGEISKEKQHIKPSSKEESDETSNENSKEENHNKSKESAGESKVPEEDSEEAFESEELKEELKEKVPKKSPKETEASWNKSKKEYKELSGEDSVEESDKVGSEKHKEAHELLKPPTEAVVPYKDIIRCIEAAMKRNYGVPAAMRQEPSPLTYIVLNKPC